MKNAGVYVGIGVAAVAGLLLGLLIAPKKGENLRKDIKDAAGDWSNKLDHLLSDGKEEFKKAKNSLTDSADDFRREVKTGKV